MPPKPKNILYFSTFGNLRWGGQKSLFHLVTRLDKQKYRPYVLLPIDEDFAEALRRQGVEVMIHALPPIGFFNIVLCLASIRYLLRLIDDHEIALMHTDGPRNTLYAGFVSWLKGIPLVFHVRASDRDRYDRIIYRCSDRIILVAGALRNRFNWVTDDTKLIIVYNGVDLSQFECAVKANQDTKKADHTENVLSIVCLSRIEPSKGQIYLIEACAKLNQIQIPFHLLFAGDVSNNEYLSDCQQKAVELKISDQIAFPGHMENILDVLSRTDIFVLPSISGEAFSRAIIEAMAMGKPVVATDVGGAKEAIENGVSGFVVPPGDSDALAERIFALATDENLRQKFGATARQRVEEFFTIEKNVEKTQQVYAELLGGNKP